MTTLERFKKLFRGGEQGYGLWDPSRPHGKQAATKPGAVPDIVYEEHLTGTLGLGLVPVQLNGLCNFAAIDIDVDTINHADLLKDVTRRGLPVTVCRSKSGGAHIYVFFADKGLPAAQVQALLKKWAAILGYPQAEIFPKQTRVGQDNVGNWINLPYFGGNTTTRYAVGPSGALSLDEFLDGARYYDESTKVDESSTEIAAQLPPCLAALQEQGIRDGSRNQALFNFAVFYRKSSPSNWKDQLSKYNSQYVSPALDFNNIKGIIASVDRKTYQYTCDNPIIAQHCNRPECLKLPYGVGFKDSYGAYDQPIITKCRKLMTTPPKYIIEINGKDVVLNWDDLFNQRNFRSYLGQNMNLIIAPKKQDDWDQDIRKLLEEMEEIAAPDDASIIGMVLDRFHEFISLRERAQSKEDLLRGLPVTVDNFVLFKANDLRRFLQGHKLDKVEGSDIFLALRNLGCQHKQIRINGRVTTVWAFPVSQVNEQTQQFEMANFAKDFESDEL